MTRETIRRYPRYTRIPPRWRELIQAKLGIQGGVMRARAAKQNPVCFVMFKSCAPIGWAAVFLPNHSMPKKQQQYPTIHLFVAHEHRRCGLGSKLFKRARAFCRGYNETFVYYPTTRRAKAFFTSLKIKYSGQK